MALETCVTHALQTHTRAQTHARTFTHTHIHPRAYVFEQKGKDEEVDPRKAEEELQRLAHLKTHMHIHLHTQVTPTQRTHRHTHTLAHAHTHARAHMFEQKVKDEEIDPQKAEEELQRLSQLKQQGVEVCSVRPCACLC